jgi:molybdenum cofactor cytidylyltransferase
LRIGKNPDERKLKPDEASIAGIVLASGLSRRFAAGNKLLAWVDGRQVVRRTVDAYLAGELRPVLVIVGFQADLVTAAVQGLGATTVSNPDFESGQSRALRRGVEALPATTRAAIIGVGDQPFLTGEVIRSMIAAYRASRASLVVPRYDGQRGNPVLFDRRLFSELLEISGDQGGRPVIENHAQEIEWVDVENAKAALDVDTDDDLREL